MLGMRVAEQACCQESGMRSDMRVCVERASGVVEYAGLPSARRLNPRSRNSLKNASPAGAECDVSIPAAEPAGPPATSFQASPQIAARERLRAAFRQYLAQVACLGERGAIAVRCRDQRGAHDFADPAADPAGHHIPRPPVGIVFTAAAALASSSP